MKNEECGMGNVDWKCRMGKWNGKLKIRNELL